MTAKNPTPDHQSDAECPACAHARNRLSFPLCLFHLGWAVGWNEYTDAARAGLAFDLERTLAALEGIEGACSACARACRGMCEFHVGFLRGWGDGADATDDVLYGDKDEEGDGGAPIAVQVARPAPVNAGVDAPRVADVLSSQRVEDDRRTGECRELICRRCLATALGWDGTCIACHVADLDALGVVDMFVNGEHTADLLAYVGVEPTGRLTAAPLVDEPALPLAAGGVG